MWIHLHDDVFESLKTQRLTRLLNISPELAVGHLGRLWHWGLRDATVEGLLPPVSEEEVAIMCRLQGDASAFTRALVTVGFLDLDGDRYRLHNWGDSGGKMALRKAANAKRNKEFRERMTDTSASRDTHVRITEASRDAHVCRERREEESREEIHVCSDAGTHEPPAASQPTEKPKRNQYPADFEAFWKAYPPRRRSEKPDAFNAWGKTTRTYTVAQIMASLEAMKRSPDWTKDGGEYVPMPGRWLRRLDPDDILSADQGDAETVDVPEPFRGKPWVFHYVKATGSKPELRVATMVHAWGFSYDALVKHVEELGSYSRAADELWRQHCEKEAAHASAAF